MGYTDLTEEQLADNFERVAQDFYKLIKDNGLESTKVDMGTPYDNRAPELNLCDTPACHGGWAAIMYGLGGDNPFSEDLEDFYLLGAYRLAEELGFEERYRLERWADEYPKYWGNEKGILIFSSNEAFNRSFKEVLHLKDIADWYMNVAKRLRGESLAI